MAELARQDFPQVDREQFAQLIGYSLSGYSDLSYVSQDSREAALSAYAHNDDPRDARPASMEKELQALREGLRGPVARLYGIHPDDLGPVES